MKLDPDRYRALKTIDLEYARRVWGDVRHRIGDPVHGDESILAGMHKARIRAGRTFTSEERAQSAEWLREHGWKVPA